MLILAKTRNSSAPYQLTRSSYVSAYKVAFWRTLFCVVWAAVGDRLHCSPRNNPV